MIITPKLHQTKYEQTKQAHCTHHLLLHLVLDVPGEGEEGLLHVDASLGGGLQELDTVLNG